MDTAAVERPSNGRLQRWLYQGLEKPGVTVEGTAHHQSPWWRVMCLTGVDYFSTLGYQPSIAFLAAGFLSPIATLILVLVTLLGALPAYARIAELSPFGQGSISVLEERLPRWRGKALVLCLLGFAATGFVITITLSAADATAHIVENPFASDLELNRILVTLALIAALSAVFIKGIREAVSVAVVIVAVYLAAQRGGGGERPLLHRQAPGDVDVLASAAVRRASELRDGGCRRIPGVPASGAGPVGL